MYDSDGTLLKNICGYLQQDLFVTSTSNKLSVRFVSDGVIETAGFLASWQAVDKPKKDNEEEEGGSDVKSQDKGYLLTFPQTFTVSKESQSENVCLQLFNVAEAGTVEVTLWNSKDLLDGNASATEVFEHSAGDESVVCQPVRLPSDFSPGSAIVKVSATIGQDYRILSYKSVRVVGQEPMLLVQTDKSDYRPKQNVKFRLLAFNYELRPAATLQVIDEVWLTNPHSSRLGQWKNVSLDRGLAQLEFQLPEEPTLGRWLIHVSYQNKTPEPVSFTVSESVLPKFEVTASGSDVLLKDSPTAEFRLCGKYTHGGTVKGKANATFFSQYLPPQWGVRRVFINVFKPLVDLDGDGCAKVTLSREELTKLTAKTNSFRLLATISEAVTGVRQNTTKSFKIMDSPFVIDFVQSLNSHILGGFPLVQQLSVSTHDGKPLEGINLEICSRLFTSLGDVRSYVTSNSHRFYGYQEDDFLQLGEKIDTLLYAKACEKHRSGSDGKIYLAIPLYDAPNNVTKLSLRATAIDHPANATSGMKQPVAKWDVALTHSNASVALAIAAEKNSKLTCFENKVEVFLSGKKGSTLDVSYFVSSGGVILLSGVQGVTVGDVDLVDQFVGDATIIKGLPGGDKSAAGEVLTKLEIPIDRPLADEGKVARDINVLVYLREGDSKGLSATHSFRADSCASQPLLRWSENKQTPGAEVQLKVEGEAESLCGYSVVDKSVDLVGNRNRITTNRVQELKEAIAKRRIVNDRTSGRGCHNANLLFRAFERMGLFVMSDQLLVDTKCDNLVDATNLREDAIALRGGSVQFSAAPQPQIAEFEDYDGRFVLDEAAPPLSTTTAGPQHEISHNKVAALAQPLGSANVRQNAVELRNYFPETWLFNLVELDAEGNAYLDLEAPHTITTWVGEVLCSNAQSGLGISNKTNLLISQDFFADINMPYSVKRGEVLPVNVSVFNTVARSLPMRLSMLASEDFNLDRASSDVCLSGKDHEIKTFSLTAKTLHEVNVTVEARITDEAKGDGEVCAAATAGEAEGYTDVLRKPIQVKPEGYPVEKVQSVFQCRGDEPNEEVTLEALTLPDDLVEGSERAWLQISGDIMAPSLANLDKLVRLPTGCGEQNMIGMTPNVYLMDYLTGTGKSEPELEATAKKYMTSGYEREQKFRHSNGAYSVWGPERDKVGSLWLTAFVVKVFSQASRFIEIDLFSVKKSFIWLLSNQDSEGCFRNAGYVIHSELSGTKQSITASVLITLLEARKALLRADILVRNLEKPIQNAVNCVRSNKTDDLYAKSLATYALTLYNSQMMNEENGEEDFEPLSEAGDWMNELIVIANTSIVGQLFWNDRSSRARSVEQSAYNVLSLTLQDKLPEALKTIRWLATQRNSRGGFVSTQDTAVALQALSQYSLKVSTSENDLAINLDDEHEFMLDEENKLLLQRQKLTQLPTDQLSATVSGRGCYMMQTVLRYNVKNSPEQKSFSVSAQQNSKGELSVCASYTGSKTKTDMAVVEVELLSGFAAVPASLEPLKNHVGAPVKKFEIDQEKGVVILYFDYIPKLSSCWQFRVKRTAKVDELKPAIVKVYDYYNQEDTYSTEYNLAE